MFRLLSRFLALIFGDFTWKPPVWPARAWARLGASLLRHPRIWTAAAVASVVVGSAGWGAYWWQKHQPKPATVAVRAVAPRYTANDKTLSPDTADFVFMDSVAPLGSAFARPADRMGFRSQCVDFFSHLGSKLNWRSTNPASAPSTPLIGGDPSAAEKAAQSREIAAHVRMDPPLAGDWDWENDHRLTFRPSADWPAGTKYRVRIDRSMFPERIHLSTYELEFTTPAFTASITHSEFYTDPRDPATKQVVATLEFTHPVDPADLEKHLSIGMIGGSEVFKANEPRYTLSYGPHRRTAYLRTCALTLPESEDFLRILITKGLRPAQGVESVAESQAKVSVPDLYTLFHVTDVTGQIVHNDDGEPEQIILVSTSTAVKSVDLAKALHIYSLPVRRPAKDSENDDEEKWGSAEVDEAVLQKALLLPAKLVPGKTEAEDVNSFRISLEKESQLYVSVAKGLRAVGGYVLRKDYGDVLDAPVLPKEVAIQGQGGILALSGERKIAVRTRAVKEIEFQIARVPADQINHLVSQTEGRFENPEFLNSSFNQDNIARISTERRVMNMKSKFKANYTAFDFSKHLQPAADGGSPLQGLFFLNVREWLPPKKKPAKAEGDAPAEAQANVERAGDDESDNKDDEEADGDKEDDSVTDSRFILVTDLGIIVKRNADRSRDVYVTSIKTGDPLGGVAVEVLAKNGVPIVTGVTAADGHLNFAPIDAGKHEKSAVAFVARRGNDVAFLPFAREDRQLDYSQFDIEGVRSISGADLDAFVFTERGIYRPGDEIHLGLLVKQRDWKGRLEGLPVEMEVLDSRGTSVQVRKLALPEGGFAETSYQTAYESASGLWHFNLYLVRQGKRDILLGSTEATVKEFLPDRMKIESRLSKEAKVGWITPDDVKATVTLRNLYGTPASDRRIAGHLSMSPSGFLFDEYPGFEFFDPLRDGKADEDLKRQTVELGDQKTDEKGEATFDLQLERFSSATYAMDLSVEGFEAGGGRSVNGQSSALVSSLPYVVGFKKDGDFSYVEMNAKRAVDWIALNPRLEKIAATDLECRLVESRYLSVLTKQENGDYAYESVLSERVVHTEPFTIPAEGLKYTLPTDVPGAHSLELHDSTGARVSKVSFHVVGRGSVSREVEKNAELQMKLSRKSYKTGEDIEISIVAPYTGAGLITIERDKVYAHAWFKADRNSTIQHIRVPEGFEGTGYVNVCFVRGLDSREVFMSPLSYATAPFQANMDERRLTIGLKIPPKVKPGDALHIGYKTDRPAKIVVFAVDQGILQVTGYETPDPLSHFFRKEALMVDTSQIVDLILPEYSVLRKAAAFGGDADAHHLNPFKRITEKPVVFWSGILDADQREREVTYETPDYFSGTLTVMAVALSPDAVGAVQKNTLVRGPFVLTPNVPTVAAPGDVFEASVTVANGTEGSGAEAKVSLKADASEHLEILKAPALPLTVPEGREMTVAFAVRARDKLGSASLVFRAALAGGPGAAETRLRSTLSVRPAAPFMTTVRGGNFTKESTIAPVERTMYPDFGRCEATVSGVPLGLARGLEIYLENYPNGCSEQISSAAMCRLVLSGEADFGLPRSTAAKQMEYTFAKLRSRQSDKGSFGYWVPESHGGIDFISAYVMDFLSEAKTAGFAPPVNVFENGMRHLQEEAAATPRTLREARIQAYMIYLLTREGVITTNYILNLRDTLRSQFANRPTSDLIDVYLAGALSILKKQDEAQKLLKNYQLNHSDPRQFWDFYSALGSDCQYLTIVARHFPELLKKVSAADLQAVLRPIGAGQFNTLSAAYAVQALKSYSKQFAESGASLGILEERRDKREIALQTDGGAVLRRAAFSANAASIRFTAKMAAHNIGAFYQTVEAGYDATLPSKAVSNGLEIERVLVTAVNDEEVRLGDPIKVRLRVRSLVGRELSNVAIVDLLPGGFEIVGESLQPGVGSAGCDFVETREDRAVFFCTIGPMVKEIVYEIKPTACGEFTVPPAFVESMYEPGVHARGVAGKIRVIDAK